MYFCRIVVCIVLILVVEFYHQNMGYIIYICNGCCVPDSDALTCAGCCSLCKLCILWPLCFIRVPLVSAGKFHAHLISLDTLQGLDFTESFSFQSGSHRGWRESNLNIETLSQPLLADWSQTADIWLPSSLSRQSQPPLESYISNPLSLVWCVFVGGARCPYTMEVKRFIRPCLWRVNGSAESRLH